VVVDIVKIWDGSFAGKRKELGGKLKIDESKEKKKRGRIERERT